jgi:hypothetical protein
MVEGVARVAISRGERALSLIEDDFLVKIATARTLSERRRELIPHPD